MEFNRFIFPNYQETKFARTHLGRLEKRTIRAKLSQTGIALCEEA